ncbi:hypothetical protein [Nocardia seriolae]|uniref:DUF5666 domain-containing protein n=1 Tax=Nocardia seriolae TaxID=37332 RepID=A0A0B8NQT2_9NOCA|nr:hypothetical protein [Nocardia seriolae]MTJ65484.1 hypothetical protein [Nocardia seriolae]MTJ75579.1 hypothetical protein [Nocardia seriolae]MTJ90365.1 hypothetical protein [Nocardia seriolae]MTK34328.1 hypothetical protein [Nocardia seriolae]MTK43471.1 hypothetical protein [Nocardia seriolae]
MRKYITAAVLAVAVAGGGIATTAVAQPVVSIQKQSPATEAALKEILADYTHHIGETVTFYGKMYNVTGDSRAAFATAAPTEYYALDGTSIELTGPGTATLTEGDFFTATATITGNETLGDPELRVTSITVTGHDNS